MTEGYQAPRCDACGHLEGDHVSGGFGFPAPPRGICKRDGCDCRQYVDAESDAAVRAWEPPPDDAPVERVGARTAEGWTPIIRERAA